jgi:hypothetical protein
MSTLAALVLVADASADEGRRAELQTPDPSGVLGNLSTRGAVIDRANPFFLSLGTNGRACITCHVPDQAWSISPPDVQKRFDETRGQDPIFRTNDGSNSPNADVSTPQARRSAYSMLLSKGLIRVGIGVPANAEFELVSVDDPYHFASAAELSLFRRPLPSTNLAFLSTVMWDGRESSSRPITFNDPGALAADLATQANDATRGHAQASRDLTVAERQRIVDFEMALFTAQQVDNRAGDLSRKGGHGGPLALSQQPFHVGINDDLGPDPLGGAFNPAAMSLFDGLVSSDDAARRAIVRGEQIFNSRSFTISQVGGLPGSLQGTCTTCHNAPNVGNHSVSLPLDIGLSDASRRTPDMPLYTLRQKGSNLTVSTTDPGRALITGKWADVGKFKGPILRGLAARAPYFHNGSAANLEAVVDFYNARFNIALSQREKSDLVAFLKAL